MSNTEKAEIHPAGCGMKLRGMRIVRRLRNGERCFKSHDALVFTGISDESEMELHTS